jgi:hypothetical protein
LRAERRRRRRRRRRSFDNSGCSSAGVRNQFTSDTFFTDT